MPNRTAKLLCAIFAGFLASAPFTSIAHGETAAAADCLAGPKDPAPQGSHWYYRIDHATKRHCWHLGTGHENLTRLAPPNASADAKPAAAPAAEPALQRSVADAHAELPGQARSPAPNQDNAQASAAKAGPGEDGGGARTTGDDTAPSTVASRWPDPTGVSSSSSSGPPAGNPGNAMSSHATQAPPPAIAGVTLTAADASSEKQSSPLWISAIVIVGALSLAGLMAAAIFRFGGARRTARRELLDDRRPIWDSPGGFRRSPSLPPGQDPRRPPAPGDDPADRIAAMLTRLSGSTPR